MKLCRKCNVNYEDPELRFCTKCGNKLEDVNICPKCHAEFDLNAVFCGKCGATLNRNNLKEATPFNTVQKQQSTQRTVPDQTVLQADVAKENRSGITSPSSPINENSESKETSNSSWGKSILGLFVAICIVFNVFKDNIPDPNPKPGIITFTAKDIYHVFAVIIIFILYKVIRHFTKSK